MNDSDKRFKERWDSIRNGGRIRYALVHGAGFGFAVFVIINLWYLNDKSFSEVYLNQRAFEQMPVSYTHLRAHETVLDLVCRLLLEKKNKK